MSVDRIDLVIRRMLDGMRNAHLQMVLGNPDRAIEHLHEAADAHHQLSVSFHGDPKTQAMAGRILYQVIDQRIDSLMGLAKEHLARPLSADEIVAFVARPLNPVR